MTGNVIRFKRPAPPAKIEPPTPTFNPDDKDEWLLALKALWNDPAHWRLSKKGHRYLVIDPLDICVVILTEDDYWTWEIRWRDGRRPTRSRWICPRQKDTFDAALEAVIALA